MHRYHTIDYVLNLPLREGVDLINKATREEQRDRMFQQWVVQLPYMDKDNYTSFEEYVDQLTGANIDTRPVDQILAELDEVEKRLEGGS